MTGSLDQWEPAVEPHVLPLENPLLDQLVEQVEAYQLADLSPIEGPHGDVEVGGGVGGVVISVLLGPIELGPVADK